MKEMTNTPFDAESLKTDFSASSDTCAGCFLSEEENSDAGGSGRPQGGEGGRSVQVHGSPQPPARAEEHGRGRSRTRSGAG